MNKLYLKPFIISVIIFSMFIFSTLLNSSVASEEYEEADDTVISSTEYKDDTDISYDDVIKGTMDEFSGNSVIVNGTKYSLCKDVMIYNTAGALILLRDIEAALEIKLFKSNRCIKKIAVLRYAQ